MAARLPSQQPARGGATATITIMPTLSGVLPQPFDVGE
jgi:hypothetical protein